MLLHIKFELQYSNDFKRKMPLFLKINVIRQPNNKMHTHSTAERPLSTNFCSCVCALIHLSGLQRISHQMWHDGDHDGGDGDWAGLEILQNQVFLKILKHWYLDFSSLQYYQVRRDSKQERYTSYHEAAWQLWHAQVKWVANHDFCEYD